MDYFEFVHTLQKREFKPVYLFYGEERYLLEQALKKLQFATVGENRNDFDYAVFEEKEGVASVIALADTMPAFASYRLIVVRREEIFSTGKKGEGGGLTEKESEALNSYIKNPNFSSIIVFVGAKEIDNRRRIVSSIKTAGAVVEFSQLKGEALFKWISTKAKEAGLNLNRAAAMYLINNCGSSLQVLDNELQKLSAYGGGQELSLEEVREVVAVAKEATIFQLVDAVAEKRLEDALVTLRNILQQGEAPPKILVMIARQFRLLLEVKRLQQAGCNMKSIAEMLKQKPFMIQKISNQARSFSIENLHAVWGLLRETDFQIKGGYLSPATALETLIFKLNVI